MERLELLSAMLLVFCPIMMLISLLTPRAAIFFRHKTRLRGLLLWTAGTLLGWLIGAYALQAGGHMPGSEGRSEVPAEQESAR